MPAHSPSHWYDEAELTPRRNEFSQGDANESAFLDMLAHAEGTVRFGDECGYNVIVGGGTFDDYSDHPRQSIQLPRYGISSTAAGRYQFLIGTWDDLVSRFGFDDFSPASQDAAALRLIEQCGALGMVREGKVAEAIHACRTIWASLPGAGYGQREVATEELVDVYRQAGGYVA